jgi:hypothetical protein
VPVVIPSERRSRASADPERAQRDEGFPIASRDFP